MKNDLDQCRSEDLIHYCNSPFGYSGRVAGDDATSDSSHDTAKKWTRNCFPLEDEPFVSAWQDYLDCAQQSNPVEVLQKPFLQWNFPVREGMSLEQSYIDVTRRFAPVESCRFATGHGFELPEGIHIQLYPSAAGRVPVLCFATRADFEYALQSLTNRNEPCPVPASIGASMIAGFNNVDRIIRHKQAFMSQQGSGRWQDEYKRLMATPEAYQDRFILISPGSYSNVAASTMGFSESDWEARSVQVRVHHEAAHYFMKRVRGSMNRHLLDELIADYVGMVLGLGLFRSDWFCAFMGFDEALNYTGAGRMEHYTHPITPGCAAFELLGEIVVSAAGNLAAADSRLREAAGTVDPVLMMLALTALTLDRIASTDGVESVCTSYEALFNAGNT